VTTSSIQIQLLHCR